MPKSSSASSAPVWPTVNRAEEATELNIAALLFPLDDVTQSPIDEYYEHARTLLLTASRDGVEQDEMLMRLLVLELVSSAELYFRRVLSAVITICPMVASTASRRQILLGSIGYYKRADIGYALLDGVSLSGEGDVKRQTLNITGFDIKQTSSVHKALKDFERVCQLRHVIVHAKGEIGAKNVADLQVTVQQQSRLRISSLAFQPLVVATHNAVRAYNAYLFECVLTSWLGNKHLSGKWRSDRKHFERLHKLFHSTTDMGTATPRATYDAFKPAIK